MQVQAEPLYNALKVICHSAWTDLKAVHFGVPRIEQKQYPHAVIRLGSIPSELIFNTVSQQYIFDVAYRGEWSSSPTFNIELEKIARANEFISSLSQNTLLGGIGLEPTVTNIDFIEADDPNEPFYELVLTVSTLVHTTWGE